MRFQHGVGDNPTFPLISCSVARELRCRMSRILRSNLSMVFLQKHQIEDRLSNISIKSRQFERTFRACSCTLDRMNKTLLRPAARPTEETPVQRTGERFPPGADLLRTGAERLLD